MEVKPGYKQTEVGVIPYEWNAVKAAEVVERNAPICYGVVQVGQDTNGGVPIVAIKYVKEIASAPLHRTSVALERPYARSRVKGGDVLISIKGTIGRVGIVSECFEGNISRELARLRPKEEYSAEYIAHQLEADGTQARISKTVVGTTRLEFSIATLRQFELPIPSTLAEQRAIAEALGDADALIESLEQLLAKKRQLKQGAMQELLRPKPDDETRLLRKVSSLKGRIGWQGLKQTEFTTNEDEPFLITGMNFKDGAIRWGEVYHISEVRYEMAPEIQLRAEDVLMTKDGTIGKVLYIDMIPYPGKASLNSHLLLFRPIGAGYHPRYLYYQLGSRRFKDFVELNKSGTTFFGLSQSAVAAYPVLLPPLAEQVRIATVLSDMDTEIAAHEAKLTKARQLKQGMMQALLTGRIRLASVPGKEKS